VRGEVAQATDGASGRGRPERRIQADEVTITRRGHLGDELYVERTQTAQMAVETAAGEQFRDRRLRDARAGDVGGEREVLDRTLPALPWDVVTDADPRRDIPYGFK